MNIQQKTNKPVKSNLRNMETQLRGELTSGSLSLSEGRLAGRIHLEIEADMLTVFLNKVQQQKDGTMWLQEKQQMAKEICGLKAQLAQTNQKNSSEEVESLRSKLETNCSELQVQLQRMNAVNEQLERDLQQERDEVKTLQEKLSMTDEALLRQKEDAMKAVESTQASHRAKLEDSVAELAKLQSAWSKSKELSLQLQQEKTSLLEDTETSRASYEAQLEEQRKAVNTLKAALKEAGCHLEKNENQWQEERSSLLQETEDLKKTLLQKAQESSETERALRSQLEDLENQMRKKNKKKKWYRRLF